LYFAFHVLSQITTIAELADYIVVVARSHDIDEADDVRAIKVLHDIYFLLDQRLLLVRYVRDWDYFQGDELADRKITVVRDYPLSILRPT
jgi:hypothetical protein